jgi:RNA-directed DNA polymerase
LSGDANVKMQKKALQQEEFKFDESGLLEEICGIGNLREAFRRVAKNRGSPGIDGVTIEAFEQNLDQELEQLREGVLSWTYKPTPVKRVEIPKPGGGIRLLGIPIIKDRVLHAAIKEVFEPLFSEHSYGFRPGRNQRQAVETAQEIVKSGKEWVVDIDLSKFFDRINHDRLIHRLRLQIKDKRVLRLIGIILRSGIMTGEGVVPSPEGSVQGSPLSPLLSNIVLDELDKELEKRGLEFCRFADDCNVFVKTERAAMRVMGSIKKFIESKLKLKVNEEKSKVAKSDRIKFLGMTIANGLIVISKTALKKAMEQVKRLTPRGSHIPIERAVKQFNEWYRGWGAYFSMTQTPAQLKAIEAHARRRWRARIAKEQKRPRFLFRKLIAMGARPKEAARTAYSNKGPWAASQTRGIEQAYPNRWFTERLGQLILSEQKLEHWQSPNIWVKLA